MKHWNGRSFLAAWGFGAVLSGAALSCPVTDYGLPVSLRLLWAACILSAGLLSLLWHLPGRGITLSLAALGYSLGLWLLRHPLLDGAGRMLEQVTACYHEAYPQIPVLSLWTVPPTADGTLCAIALAIPLGAMAVWVVARRLSLWPVLLWCGLWLGTCLVVVDQLPALWAMGLLLSAGLVLVMTQGVRREDPAAGFRLTWLLALPVAALVLGLAWWQPPGDYQRAAWPDALQRELNEQILRLAGVEISGQQPAQWDVRYANGSSTYWSAGEEQVDLSRLGPRWQSQTKLLEVMTTVSGRIYLRGASLGGYGDNRWQSVPLSTRAMGPTVERVRSLRVRTEQLQPLLYTAYFPGQVPGSPTGDGRYANDGGLLEYDVWYDPSPALQSWTMADQYDDPQTALAVYTAVPEQTRAGLLRLAEAAGLTGLTTQELPEAVAAYVRQAAEYSLEVGQMPAGEDFVLWFLEQSRMGYCVHFATATALMLRTLGIPARYVTGFVVQARGGLWTDVTEADAHAWVEYYQDGIGWVPLESTPGSRFTLGTIAAPEQPETVEEPDEPEQPETPETPELPEEPEQPETPEAQTPTAAGDRPVWRYVLGIVLALLALLGALIASRPLRLRVRQRQLRGGPNEQAVIWWRQIVRLSRHAGVAPPAALERLTQKARFSQHQLTPEELAQYPPAAAALTAQLREERGWRRRLWIRWIWADC